MAKINKIPTRIYRTNTFVFIGKKEELIDWAERNKEQLPGFAEAIKEDHEDFPSSSAVTYNNENTNIVWLPRFPKTNIETANLAHELLHVVFNTLDYTDVEYIPYKKNEAYTYFLSYLMEDALNKEYYEEVKYDESD